MNGKSKCSWGSCLTCCSAAGHDDGGMGTALMARLQQQRVSFVRASHRIIAIAAAPKDLMTAAICGRVSVNAQTVVAVRSIG